MPVTSKPSPDTVWRQSWPPVQIYLQQQAPANGNSGQQDVADIAPPPHQNNTPAKFDDSPMAYFLAPPRPLLSYDDDDDDDDLSSYHTDVSDIDLDTDAGIEDAAHPHPTVRSVSPSSLAENNRYISGGRFLRRRTGQLLRPPTPPRRSTNVEHGARVDYDDDDDDDDDDDYVHFGMAVPVPMSLRAAAHTARTAHAVHSNGPALAQGARTADNASTTAYTATAIGHGQMRPVRRRSPRSWRVPSPAVFPIEEETEQDEERYASSTGGVILPTEDWQHKDGERENDAAMLPIRKQVRFVLPTEGV